MARAVAAATRLALAALAGTQGQTAFLWEAGREGLFKWEASDLSSRVAADTAQGVYVAPATDADGSSGAWVRVDAYPLKAAWFGLGPSKTDLQNKAAIEAALAFLEATGIGLLGYGLAGTELWYPFANCLVAGDIDCYVMVKHRGFGTGFPAGTPTSLTCTTDSDLFIVQRADTAGATGGSVVTGHASGGAGTTFKGIHFKGNYAGFPLATAPEAEHSAVRFRAAGHIEECTGEAWAGDIFRFEATSGAEDIHGNCNNSSIFRVWGQNCRNVVYINGADANNITTEKVHGAYCRQALIYDSAFLPGNHENIHSDACGIIDGSLSLCSNGTYMYYCVLGQEDWCSDNPPPAGQTSNQGWRYFRVGGPTTGARLWVADMTWRAGGPFIGDSPTADAMVTGYTESGDPPSQLTGGWTTGPGLMAAGSAGGSSLARTGALTNLGIPDGSPSNDAHVIVNATATNNVLSLKTEGAIRAEFAAVGGGARAYLLVVTKLQFFVGANYATAAAIAEMTSDGLNFQAGKTLNFASITNAVDDAAAATAGVPVGSVYRNGSVLMVRAA